MRGLIRRIQNRGYATLPRIADHIDSLTAGDESNAVIEALDAVNLMTVHASKGLEFPIVFVVNLAQGATGPPRPVRVVVDGEGGEPSVSVGPFVSETRRGGARAREARDPAAAVCRAHPRPRPPVSVVRAEGRRDAAGRGSLAEVLPDSVRALFSQAATASSESTGSDGRDGQVVLSSGAFASCRLRPRRWSWRPRRSRLTQIPGRSRSISVPWSRPCTTRRVPLPVARGRGAGPRSALVMEMPSLAPWCIACCSRGMGRTGPSDRDQLVHARNLLRGRSVQPCRTSS